MSMLWTRGGMLLSIFIVFSQMNYGCSHSDSNATKPDLSLIPKIGPSLGLTQLEFASVSSDFNPSISAKDALKIANGLIKGYLGNKQPERIRVEPVPENKSSKRKIWSISYWGESIREPQMPIPQPLRLDNKGRQLPPIGATQKDVRTILAIGLDPDTGKSRGIIFIPEASWKSWIPPSEKEFFLKTPPLQPLSK